MIHILFSVDGRLKSITVRSFDLRSPFILLHPWIAIVNTSREGRTPFSLFKPSYSMVAGSTEVIGWEVFSKVLGWGNMLINSRRVMITNCELISFGVNLQIY